MVITHIFVRLYTPLSHDQTQDKMVFVATNDGSSSATESDRRSPTSAPSEVREPFLFTRGFLKIHAFLNADACFYKRCRNFIYLPKVCFIYFPKVCFIYFPKSLFYLFPQSMFYISPEFRFLHTNFNIKVKSFHNMPQTIRFPLTTYNHIGCWNLEPQITLH